MNAYLTGIGANPPMHPRWTCPDSVDTQLRVVELRREHEFVVRPVRAVGNAEGVSKGALDGSGGAVHADSGRGSFSSVHGPRQLRQGTPAAGPGPCPRIKRYNLLPHARRGSALALNQQ